MDQSTVTFWLSVGLAALKVYEVYSDRRRKIEANVRLTSSEQVGNTIVLLNKSKNPVTISYFDLVWVERRKLFGISIPFSQRIFHETSPIDPPDAYDEQIPSHGVHHLVFIGDDHFNWGGDLEQAIYLRLWLHGRKRPVWLYVTGPGLR